MLLRIPKGTNLCYSAKYIEEAQEKGVRVDSLEFFVYQCIRWMEENRGIVDEFKWLEKYGLNWFEIMRCLDELSEIGLGKWEKTGGKVAWVSLVREESFDSRELWSVSLERGYYG